MGITKCERPPGRGSVSDGLNAMPCLAASIDRYIHPLNEQQADFILLRFAAPSDTWVSIGDVANRLVERLASTFIDNGWAPPLENEMQP
jgi:hypothetical protein